jgi:putative transposase
VAGRLTLAKQSQPLVIHWSRHLPKDAKPTSVIVSRDTLNRYFVSILIEEDIKPLGLVEQSVGVDVGLKSFLVLSTGESVANPKYYAKSEKMLATLQRRHARKKKGSKNKNKARQKVAKLHAHIAAQRNDFQHKLSTRLIRENQVVCVETLAVKNMVKNHKLAKAVSDVGWSEFIRQLEYKAQWYGRTLVKIDRWFPSSKTCSACGHVLETLTLDVREWTCPICGVVHNRDINAAQNIHAEGHSVLKSVERMLDVRVPKGTDAVLVEAENLTREGGNPPAF